MRFACCFFLTASLAVACLPDLDRGSSTPSGDEGSNPGSTPGAGDPKADPNSPSTTDDGGTPSAPTCSPSLQTDAKNCGSCGRDCRGASCSGGLCVPQDLSKNLYDPFAVVVGDGKVYFSTLGPTNGSNNLKTVREVAVDGTGERTLTSGVRGVTDLALMPNLVLFRTWDEALGGTIRACYRTGSCTETMLVDAVGWGRGLVTTPNFFYWGGTYALRRCTVLGCAPAAGVIMQSSVAVEGVVSDGPSLYWSNSDLNYGGYAIYKCAVPGCLEKTPLYSRSKAPTAIALAGQTMCWAEKASVVCGNTAGAGGAPNVVFNGDAKEEVTSVAVDQSHVYFTVAHEVVAQGRVLRAPTTKTTPNAEELAKGQARPRGVALDATHVYWATAPGDSTGMLRRIAK